MDILRPIFERRVTTRTFVLRFGLVFAALQIVPLFASMLPIVGGWFAERWGDVDGWVVDTFGQQLLGTDAIVDPQTGSGDTAFAYVELLVFVVVALIAAATWTLAARRLPVDRRLSNIARVGLRYALAITMLSYGLSKVFVTQFPGLQPFQLYEPVGHMTPMCMLWTFMGASAPYTIFGGAMECIGGALLLWPRTTTLGAVVLVPVLGNVVALNFCYDVPVKLLSSELLIATLVLLAPDARRLVAAMLGRPTEASTPPPPISRRRRIAIAVAKVLVVGWIGYAQISGQLDARATSAESRSPLFGAWQVERFERDGAELAPLATASDRWRLLVIGDYAALLRTMDDADGYTAVERADNTRLELGDAGAFDVTPLGPERLRLIGTSGGHRLVVEVHRTDDSRMELLHRGFHWSQEAPHNY